MYPPTPIEKVVFPDGSVVNMGDQPRKRVFSYGETYEADTVLKTVITSGTGTAAELRLPGGRQDGDRREPLKRLVRRLHPEAFDRRVGRLSRTTTTSRRLRGDGRGADLARLHAAASDGYCGDWTPPTVPWTGSAFTGPHSSARRSKAPKNAAGANPYLNPNLFAQPPRAQARKPPARQGHHRPGGGGHQPGGGKKH